MTATYDAALVSVDLRATQFTLLQKLKSRGPETIGQLADVMAMDRTTLAANLKPLERDGLVHTALSASDRRAKVVSLTKRGAERFDQALPLWESAQARFEEAYGATRAASLRELAGAVPDTQPNPWA
ncbi:MarR family transcriptional regulator [Arthrobacter sp. NicSoilB8]|uniref:MarR family winged helix-turn-helix transcriptional regulator n=1 Tax=Arthrobacter sp. NicSoilB8 TaxID=2830998 RepID=UPI001CC6A0CE|nr:MarR family transcriptional regulator [Arthrobacter sp. NicSoilB8]